jgi:hypothetical protein
MTREHFDCPLDPERELKPVGDGVLAKLRNAAAGLADDPESASHPRSRSE